MFIFMCVRLQCKVIAIDLQSERSFRITDLIICLYVSEISLQFWILQVMPNARNCAIPPNILI
jgi:hypothetical protein